MPAQRLPGAADSAPIRRSGPRALPTRQTNPMAPGHSIASSGGRVSSVLTSMGRTTPSRRRVAVWDDLDAIEQSLLAVAAGERTLDLACTSWAAPPLRGGVLKMTMRAAGRLHELGLIGFYRIEDGYPDLGEHELNLVFSDRSHWECGPDDAGRLGRVGMYLTTAGEDLVLGP